MDTVDNAGDPTYWPGCLKCMVYSHGVPLRIYKAAVELAVERGHRYYYIEKPEGHTSEEYDRWLKLQVEGATMLILRVLDCLKKVDDQ